MYAGSRRASLLHRNCAGLPLLSDAHAKKAETTINVLAPIDMGKVNGSGPRSGWLLTLTSVAWWSNTHPMATTRRTSQLTLRVVRGFARCAGITRGGDLFVGSFGVLGGRSLILTYPTSETCMQPEGVRLAASSDYRLPPWTYSRTTPVTSIQRAPPPVARWTR